MRNRSNSEIPGIAQTQSPVLFSLGDIVTFGGLRGQVTRLQPAARFGLFVTFDDGSYHAFTTDGKLSLAQTESLLVLVGRMSKNESATASLAATA